MIKENYELVPIDNSLEIGPASEYNFADGKGKIGIITSSQQSFLRPLQQNPYDCGWKTENLSVLNRRNQP